MPSPFPLVFKALARLPLPLLHNLGALAGWLAWLLSATYRRNFLRHIEQAGIHSGDSACSLPPYTLSPAIQDRMRQQMTQLGHALKVVGLMNAQFAIKDDDVYILEVNPRASRTVPFVSKAIGVPLAKVAARCMVGRTLIQQGHAKELKPKHYFVKEAVFPFIKFPGVDTVLGPEMKSTGEVMGVGETFGEPFGKAGAYAIQGRGATFVAHLSGSFSAVMGVPLHETAGLLRGFGFAV